MSETVYDRMRARTVARIAERLEAEKALAFQAIDLLESINALGEYDMDVEVNLSVEAAGAYDESPLGSDIDQGLSLSNAAMTVQEIVVALYGNGRKFQGKTSPAGAVASCLYARKRDLSWSMTGHPRRWYKRKAK